MSHIQCPLCGLNSPLSKFDPSALDLDLRLVQFRGLGRGRGFEVSNEFSVLGDEEYSPMVAERVLSLCGMFLDNGVMSRGALIDRLGLRDAVMESGEFVPKKEYETALILMNLYSAELEKIKYKSDSLEQELISVKLDFEEKEMEWMQNKKVERELLKIIQKCNTEIFIDDESSWTAVIKELDESGLNTLIDVSKKLDPELRRRIFKRLKAEDVRIQEILEFLLLKMPREKSLAEEMLEMDFNFYKNEP